MYADDLVLIAESMDDLRMMYTRWKVGMESKGLRVNEKKTKLMFSDCDKDSGRWPCAICRKGVGSNSMFCSSCSHWVHKRCSGLKGTLRHSDYKCSRCSGVVRSGNAQQVESVVFGDDRLEIVDNYVT